MSIIREEPEAKGRFPQSDLGQGNLFTSLLSLSSLFLPSSSPVVHNRPFLSPIFFMSRRSLVFAVAATSHVPIYRPAARLLRLAPFGLLRELYTFSFEAY